MRISIINCELSIASSSCAELKEIEPAANNLIMVYSHKKDWMIFNENAPHYRKIIDMVVEYLGLEDKDKKRVLDMVKQENESLYSTLRAVNRVTRIHRKLEGNRCA